MTWARLSALTAWVWQQDRGFAVSGAITASAFLKLDHDPIPPGRRVPAPGAARC
jgi:hypothetical protein